jgi:hypothetical protein
VWRQRALDKAAYLGAESTKLFCGFFDIATVHVVASVK